MKSFFILIACSFVLLGCTSKPSESEKIYPIKGKVISVDVDKKEVKLDHDDIPGLMGPMKMSFSVEDADLLAGLKPDALVEGKLKVGNGKQILISLTQKKSTADEEAEIRANLEKLSPEDRKLAEAQRFCAVQDERLGSMDVPIKLDVKGQPVFVCCKGCEFKVKKNPDAILAKVAELKKAPR